MKLSLLSILLGAGMSVPQIYGLTKTGIFRVFLCPFVVSFS